MAWRLLRYGLFGSAVYVTNEVGIWKDSKTTAEISKEIYKFTAPYYEDVAAQVPELPRMSDLSNKAQNYWNHGVYTSVIFLGDLPSLSVTWACCAYKYVNGKVSEMLKSSEEQIPETVK